MAYISAMSETANISLEFLASGMERMLSESRDIRDGQQELGAPRGR
jgi:hypothetical protein